MEAALKDQFLAEKRIPFMKQTEKFHVIKSRSFTLIDICYDFCVFPQILMSVRQKNPTVHTAASTLRAPTRAFATPATSWGLTGSSATVSSRICFSVLILQHLQLFRFF